MGQKELPQGVHKLARIARASSPQTKRDCHAIYEATTEVLLRIV